MRGSLLRPPNIEARVHCSALKGQNACYTLMMAAGGCQAGVCGVTASALFMSVIRVNEDDWWIGEGFGINRDEWDAINRVRTEKVEISLVEA
jgi:hypothetical protein